MNAKKRKARLVTEKSGRKLRRWRIEGVLHTTTSARWTYEMEHGEQPTDVYICHRDLDTRNDAPGNLIPLGASGKQIHYRQHPHIMLAGVEHRWCAKCQQYHPLDCYYRKGDGLQARCKDCARRSAAEHARNHL